MIVMHVTLLCQIVEQAALFQNKTDTAETVSENGLRTPEGGMIES